jgi:hypothetical protein
MIASIRPYHLFLLVGAALFVRFQVFIDLDNYLVGWRPTDLASVSRNFLNNGFHLFYPQIDWGGNGPGFVEMEFPVIPWVVALMEKWFGLSNLFALLIPLVSSFGTVIVTYQLARYLYGETVAFIAGLVVAVSPVYSAWSQAFVGDPSVVFLTALAVYAFVLWSDSKGRWYFLLSALAAALGGLLKPVGLMIGVPMIVICYSKDGWKFLRRPVMWLYAALVVVPVALWYYHGWKVGEAYGNSFGVLTHGYLKYATKELLTSPVFYARMVWRIMLYYLTPLMFVGFIGGLLVKPGKGRLLMVPLWVAMNAVYIVAFAEGNNQMVYYQLPILVPAAILAGLGWKFIWDALAKRKFLGWLTGRVTVAGVALCVLLFTGSVAVGTMDYHIKADYRPQGKLLKEMGVKVGSLLRPGSLIIYTSGDVNHEQMKYSMTPPDIFYHSGHKGWYRALAWLTIPMIEEIRSQGAQYFVSHRQEFLDQRADIDTYLRGHYTVVYEQDNTIVFDLGGKRE